MLILVESNRIQTFQMHYAKPLSTCVLGGLRSSSSKALILSKSPVLLHTLTSTNFGVSYLRVGHHQGCRQKFSTLARWDLYATPPTCYHMRDREILSESIARKGGMIFLDVRETSQGSRYVKVTERNWDKAKKTDYIYVGMDDFPQFFDSLKAVDAGKKEEEVVLSGEGLHISSDGIDVRLSKHRRDGKTSVIFFSRKELGRVLNIFKKILNMKVNTCTINLSRREAGAVMGSGGRTRKLIESENKVRIKIMGKKEDPNRDMYISGTETDTEKAKEMINEILTYESMLITKLEAGVLLGADGGPVHVIDVENKCDAVVEVFCYELHYFYLYHYSNFFLLQLSQYFCHSPSSRWRNEAEDHRDCSSTGGKSRRQRRSR